MIYRRVRFESPARTRNGPPGPDATIILDVTSRKDGWYIIFERCTHHASFMLQDVTRTKYFVVNDKWEESLEIAYIIGGKFGPALS